MKKRFNFISITILAILVISIMSFTYDQFEDVIMGHKSNQNNEIGTIVDLKPIKENSHLFIFKNQKDGSDIQFYPNNISVSFSNSTDYSSLWDTLILIMALPFIISSLACIIYFIKFIVSVNKGRIFEHINTHYLKVLGISLIVCAISEILISFFIYKMNTELLSFEGYKINFEDIGGFLNLILGLSALLVAQFLKMGITMKEEQELTI